VHTGSVHYGGASRAQIAPGFRGGNLGGVRARGGISRGIGFGGGSRGSVYYAGSGFGGGGYRNPYRSEYFNRFRVGYFPYIYEGAQYYAYNDLPATYQIVVINGITYYVADGIYYQAYINNGQTVYVAVPVPE
jgi:hypothetical protein